MFFCVSKLRKFLRGSKSFVGVDFQGHYMMKTEDFLEMFQHFLLSGENKLDEYSKSMWDSWEANSKNEG